VLPCWNEAEGIAVTLDVAAEAGELACRSGDIVAWEVVAVDDGSTDGTSGLLAGAAARDARFRVVSHPHNRGLGAAIRSGFAAARGDLVLYTDADLPCDLVADLPRALRLARLRNAGVVAAYRRNRTGEGPRRAVYSVAYNGLARTAYGLRFRDMNFAFKLLSRQVMDRLELKSEGSFIDVEILARAQAEGFTVVQFGTDYFPRTRGVSALSSCRTIGKIVHEMVTVGGGIDRSRLHAGRVRSRRRRRLLIVNADDYGLTEGVSEGILRAHESGIVTSTSILVLGRAFAAAAPRLAGLEDIGVGVHLAAVGEDRPLLSAAEIPTLVDERGRLPRSWRSFVARAAVGLIDPADVEREFRAQLELVTGLGLPLTHLDTHQHLHLWPLVGKVVIRLAAESGIPAIRVPRSASTLNGVAIDRLADRLAEEATAGGLAHPGWSAGLDQAGRLHGQRLKQTIAALAARGCDAELGCHPGDPSDTAAYRWGYDWDQELAAFSSPSARRWVEDAGFRLGSYRDLVPHRA